MKVLFIDDDHDICELFQTEMVDHGWRVDVAHNADDGGMLMLNDKYDVVITDLRMPLKKGDRLVNAFNMMPIPESDRLFIVMSGFLEQEIVDELLQKGSHVHCLEKPTTPDDVIALIEGKKLHHRIG